jgi:hypothetical protein
VVGDWKLDVVDVDAQHLGKRRCRRAAGQDDGELRDSARVRRRKISWGLLGRGVRLDDGATRSP